MITAPVPTLLLFHVSQDTGLMRFGPAPRRDGRPFSRWLHTDLGRECVRLLAAEPERYGIAVPRDGAP